MIGFTEEAIAYLCEYDYPGNVRELENLIERALILSTGPQIEVGEWLPNPFVNSFERGCSKLEQVERDMILERLQAHKGNLSLGRQGSRDQPDHFVATNERVPDRAAGYDGQYWGFGVKMQ